MRCVRVNVLKHYCENKQTKHCLCITCTYTFGGNYNHIDFISFLLNIALVSFRFPSIWVIGCFVYAIMQNRSRITWHRPIPISINGYTSIAINRKYILVDAELTFNDIHNGVTYRWRFLYQMLSVMASASWWYIGWLLFRHFSQSMLYSYRYK